MIGLLLALTAAVGAQGEVHTLIVTGVGGEDRYRESFPRTALELRESLIEAHGASESNFTMLAGDRGSIPGAERASRENLLAALARFGSELGPRDRLAIFYIGHGSRRGEEAVLNLPGPDMSAAELATALTPLGNRVVAFVHTGSSSAPFVESLSGENRLVITATGTARESNATRFPEHLLSAFRSPDDADLDKDNRVSLLEAFQYANREVERTYSSGGTLRTEHALLDDNGDGEGSQEPDPITGDGALARGFFFESASVSILAGPVSDDPELIALYDNKSRIENSINELRAIREEMDPDEYDDRLEELILDLAETNALIREAEGGAQ